MGAIFNSVCFIFVLHIPFRCLFVQCVLVIRSALYQSLYFNCLVLVFFVFSFSQVQTPFSLRQYTAIIRLFLIIFDQQKFHSCIIHIYVCRYLVFSFYSDFIRFFSTLEILLINFSDLFINYNITVVCLYIYIIYCISTFLPSCLLSVLSLI